MTEAATYPTRADNEIERFIKRRSSERRDPDDLDSTYQASVERHRAKVEAARRERWIRYHFDQAALAAQHREKTASLREGGS